MAKNLADPGLHLCQVHWNQRTSYKVMAPMCDCTLMENICILYCCFLSAASLHLAY